MMYSNKLAVAIKANGKVLREFGETVYVPFGTEYTILIKNMNSVRAQVTVSIDGTPATENATLVIGPNREIELQRFVKNGNLTEGNRFKFIERTSKIEQGPRGAKIDDGLIRIEYQFERVPAPINRIPLNDRFYMPFGEHDRYTLANHVARSYDGDMLNASSVTTQVSLDSYATMAAPTTSGVSFNTTTTAVNNYSQVVQPQSRTLSRAVAHNAVAQNAAVPQNEVGITVAGSKSTQMFALAENFPVDSTVNVMVIHLAGETETGKSVSIPVTVKAKPRCITCGHLNKATAKFCSECGTSLEIV